MTDKNEYKKYARRFLGNEGAFAETKIKLSYFKYCLHCRATLNNFDDIIECCDFQSFESLDYLYYGFETIASSWYKYTGIYLP